MLRKNEKGKIVKALRERGALRACEACGQRAFMLLPDVTQVRMSAIPAVFDGPVIPAIGVVCKHCGNIRVHSLAILRLLDIGQRGWMEVVEDIE